MNLTTLINPALELFGKSFSYILIFISILVPFKINAQLNCEMEQITSRATTPNEEYEAFVREFYESGSHLFREVKIIPTVVHVFYKSAEDSISYERVLSQIESLNADFRRKNSDTLNTHESFKSIAADCQIEFCLAQKTPEGLDAIGIVWHYISERTHSKVHKIIREKAWDRKRYLNIYVIPIATGGIGYFPWYNVSLYDGIHIPTIAFGTIGDLDSNFKSGGMATHEIGHYLGLFHIFQSFESDIDFHECSDENCRFTGDRVCDTPAILSSSSQCLNEYHNCANGSLLLKQNENFMSYSKEHCFNMFTEGQKVRMHATLSGLRSGLCTEDNLIRTGCINSTKIDLQIKASNFKVFPQPANNEITIVSEDFIGACDIYLMNMYGDILKSWNSNLMEENTFNLETTAPGIYLIIIQNKGIRAVRKIIITQS